MGICHELKEIIMAGNMCWSCGLCAACRPRYQRLVDSIYPSDPTGTLVKANMQKLTFYAISHPEKLDKIGEYIAYRLSRDLYRQRQGNVRVAAEAMDQLLAACHGSPSLNLFIESFLKVVQKLLETNDAGLEIMATKSFVNFSTIEEDIPGYHRRYDFFISKFSSLCHNNDSNLAVRDRLRVAGLKGLRGVVKKTATDDLQANIWERQHMEKIVPSILFNVHDKGLDERPGAENPDEPDASSELPKTLADTCFRELIGKASFGSMKSVLTPVLKHCDNHNLWTPPAEHAIAVFRAVMYSIQNQYLHVVIQMLISHLDSHGNSKADLRIGIAMVLSEIVLIAATSIGPGLLDIFNSLMRHLRSSVELQLSDNCGSIEAEKRYQETLINTMAEFANSLPDYQKVEIMMFIIGKVPMGSREMKRSDTFLQNVLMKTLLKVATKYCTNHLSAVLTPPFLEPLLKLAGVENSNVRLLTQQILHTLLDSGCAGVQALMAEFDEKNEMPEISKNVEPEFKPKKIEMTPKAKDKKHQNLSILQHVRYVPDVNELNLTVEKCSRADQMFMHKSGAHLLSTIYKCATDARIAGNNTPANYDALLCTMLLLVVELAACDQVLVDLLRLTFAMQSYANDSTNPLTPQHKIALNLMVCWFVNVCSQLLAIPSFYQHVQIVIKTRAAHAHPALNPFEPVPINSSTDDPLAALESLLAERDDNTFEMLFSRQTVADALQCAGKDVTRLGMPFTSRLTTDSLALATGRLSPSGNQTDAQSISFSMASVDSSPDNRLSRRGTIFAPGHDETDAADVRQQPLTVDALRQMVQQTPEAYMQSEQREAELISEQFSQKPFADILSYVKQQHRPTQDNIARILRRVKDRESRSCEKQTPVNVHDIELPEMFVY